MSEPKTTGHDYDGIQEYDNPLPGWWSGIFIVTIVFAPIYVWWYHLGGPGKSMHQSFDDDWKGYVAWKSEAEKSATVDVTEELLAQWAHDPNVIANGRQIFTEKCVGCHLDDGRGQIGPNLTDEFQIHGSQRLDLFQTIKTGVPDKGMIAWGESMQPREMAQVAAYVSTLRGHPVAGGKEPQGEKVGPFE